MREIVLDTETTGLSVEAGDRIVEIAAIALQDGLETGERYQTYLNPERALSSGAMEVHGLSSAFLEDKPRFADIAEEFLAFIGEERLVIHNAPFDLGFLNAELARMGRETLSADRALDTLSMARIRWPGAPNSLEALCQRLRIDDSRRRLHGALLDAELLVEVYQFLTGVRRQGRLDLAAGAPPHRELGKAIPAPLPHAAVMRRLPPNEEELRDHARLVKELGRRALWNKI